MSLVPESRLGRIEFYEAHLTPWADNVTDIGLSLDQVTHLGSLTNTARMRYNEAEAARLASKAATQAYYDAVRTMHSSAGAGADMIKTIKTFASTTNNPEVYVLAQIPAPAEPTESPAPGTPFDFKVELLQNGALELKWKVNNPAGTAGTIYEVRRRDGGETTPFTYVGATGIKSFTDETLPGGCADATYEITAVRSTRRGHPARFTVTYGNAEQAEPQQQVRLAA